MLHGYEQRTSFPAHMRHRLPVDLTCSDRRLFESMEIGDVWIDGKMHLVWDYIYRSKHVKIPPSWQNAIEQFNDELTRLVPSLHCIGS